MSPLTSKKLRKNARETWTRYEYGVCILMLGAHILVIVPVVLFCYTVPYTINCNRTATCRSIEIVWSALLTLRKIFGVPSLWPKSVWRLLFGWKPVSRGLTSYCIAMMMWRMLMRMQRLVLSVSSTIRCWGVMLQTTTSFCGRPTSNNDTVLYRDYAHVRNYAHPHFWGKVPA